MTSKHTPGPWELVENSWAVTSIYAPDRQGLVCELNMGEVEEDQYEALEAIQSANAKLIAAAPDLLKSAQLDDLFPATTLEQQEHLEQFAVQLGWDEKSPVEFFARSYRRAAIKKAGAS